MNLFNFLITSFLRVFFFLMGEDIKYFLKNIFKIFFIHLHFCLFSFTFQFLIDFFAFLMCRDFFLSSLYIQGINFVSYLHVALFSFFFYHSLVSCSLKRWYLLLLKKWITSFENFEQWDPIGSQIL